MHVARIQNASNERALNRLIVGMIIVLAVGIPAIGTLYFLDQYRDPGPSLTQRTVDAAEAAVRKQPNLVSARIALADAYAQAGRYEDAAAQYGEVLGRQPTNGGALLGRAAAYQKLENTDGAARDYQAEIDAASGGEMAKVDPQLEAAYFGLASIVLERGDATQASALLDKALVIQPTDADALNLMGRAQLALGDVTSAIESLENATALVPTGWCEPYADLSKAYAQAGDPSGAQYAAAMQAYCEKGPAAAQPALASLTTGPHAADALLGLGLVAEETGDSAAAAGYYARVLQLRPGDFNATSGLSRLGGAGPGGSSPAPSAPSSAVPSTGQ